VDLPRSYTPPIRTDEDTVALLRRLAAHYPDATIAGILDRCGPATGWRARRCMSGCESTRPVDWPPWWTGPRSRCRVRIQFRSRRL
jgi:hypothetical protein